MRRKLGEACLWYRTLVDICEGEIEVAVEAARQDLLVNPANSAGIDTSALASSATATTSRASNPFASLTPSLRSDNATTQSPMLVAVPTAPLVDVTYAHPYNIDYTLPAGRAHISCRSSQAQNPSIDHSGKERASAYLRACCPACFGGNKLPERNEDGIPYVTVAIDANFQQKRTKKGARKKKKKEMDADTSDEEDPPTAPAHQTEPTAEPFIVDPPLPMNRTRELDKELVQMWQKKSSEVRSKKDASKKRAESNPMPDVVEDGLKVPNSVLDGCEESFTAADEFREKASARYFECTGIAAMVCKHDIALFWTNVYTAGEGHFYAYAMIEQLMLHLPPSWHVGVLYDIGCTVHRSVVKWGILKDYVDRLVFAISVFHAYGHQWVCQIHYHPRKQRIWGLTDGEGNERIWFLLSHLISMLRNAGYFQRLWILSMQFNEVGGKFVNRLGDWVWSRLKKTGTRREEADRKLNRIMKKLAEEAFVDPVFALPPGVSRRAWIRSQWDDQVAYQSRPTLSDAKATSNKIVNTILSLEDAIALSVTRIKELKTELAELPQSDMSEDNMLDRDEVVLEIESERSTQKANKEKLALQRKSLGLSDKATAKKLHDKRTKALYVLLARIRARRVQARDLLRARKMFQMNTSTNMRVRPADMRVRQHTDAALKTGRRKIDNVIRQHNVLVKEAAVKAKASAERVTVPSRIDPKVIWSKDIPDAILDSAVELNGDEFDESGGPPLWLASRRVQKAIRIEQEATNCREEIRKCERDIENMHSWAEEQLAAFDHSIASRRADGVWNSLLFFANVHASANSTSRHSDFTMRYHLQHARHKLLSTLYRWQRKLPSDLWEPLTLPTMVFTDAPVEYLPLNRGGGVGDDRARQRMADHAGSEGTDEEEEEEEEFEELGAEVVDRYSPNFQSHKSGEESEYYDEDE